MFSFRKVGYSLIICMLACTIAFAFWGWGDKKDEAKSKPVKEEIIKNNDVNQEKSQPIVTFVELGSVKCIPCKMMQPVMEAIEKDYGDQVKVVFYDVWTEEGRPYAEEYGVKGIPTQVFLDKDGKEFHRHVGFYPQEEIEKVLEEQGVTKQAKKEEAK